MVTWLKYLRTRLLFTDNGGQYQYIKCSLADVRGLDVGAVAAKVVEAAFHERVPLPQSIFDGPKYNSVNRHKIN